MELAHVSVVGSGGAILSCRHTGIDPGKPSVLIALPFGVPADVARAACVALAPSFNVATWESRYVLNIDQPFAGDEPVAPGNHVEDMVRILSTLGIESCRLIGYCSGGGISLLAAAEHPELFTELLLVNGEYQLFRHAGHASTDYQRSIDTFLPVVAGGRREARFIFEKMAEISKARKKVLQSDLDEQINRPFSQEEYLFRYAKNYMGYRTFAALDVAARVRQRTFVLTGARDEHSSMENSQAVAAAIPGTSMFVDPIGDHYEFCRHGSAILAEISSYLSAKAGSTAGGPALTIGT